jgi:hypothetical protein
MHVDPNPCVPQPPEIKGSGKLKKMYTTYFSGPEAGVLTNRVFL